MTESRVSNLDRYALIAWLAKQLGGDSHRLGKKALQKIVHLIQELGDVDFGYRFSFHTYGPYSSELAGDLDVVAAIGGVKVTYNSSDNYYLIHPGTATDSVIDKGNSFVQANRAGIDKVLKLFGGRLAKELELVSTITYLRRHTPRSEFEDDVILTARVKALKPKYNAAQIEKAIAEVKTFLAA
jgi:uncharacterized protein YwgA